MLTAAVLVSGSYINLGGSDAGHQGVPFLIIVRPWVSTPDPYATTERAGPCLHLY